MNITTVGIDLAKNIFQVHGVDERGKPDLRKSLKRSQVASFFANLPVCLIGIEACASAHHWARKLQSVGHEVHLIAPQFVTFTLFSSGDLPAFFGPSVIGTWLR